MKSLSVYQNLDTSFVNLSALIRYLREQSFIGRVQIRLRGYEAEITFGAENQLTVLEHDRIAGRIAEGDEALQRILIRAKNGGGKINVLETAENAEPVSRELKLPTYLPISKPLDKPFSEKESASVKEPAPVPAPVPLVQNGSGRAKKDFQPIPVVRPANDFLNLLPENHAPLPLEFTNRVENRARQTQIPTGEWQTLLRLTGELYAAVENVLNNADLNFSSMLSRARAEISDDYPFLDPSAATFSYGGGKAEMTEQVSAKIFAASVNEMLRRIMDRLAEKPKYAEVSREATQKILALIHQNQMLYDRFFITPRLSKNLGV